MQLMDHFELFEGVHCYFIQVHLYQIKVNNLLLVNIFLLDPFINNKNKCINMVGMDDTNA